jgi:hypothetical protein
MPEHSNDRAINIPTPEFSFHLPRGSPGARSPPGAPAGRLKQQFHICMLQNFYSILHFNVIVMFRRHDPDLLPPVANRSFEGNLPATRRF